MQPIVGDLCDSLSALVAFGWLNWIICKKKSVLPSPPLNSIFTSDYILHQGLLWFFFILTLCIISHTRGNSGVWTHYVTEVDFLAYKSSGGVVSDKSQPQITVPVVFQYGGLGSPTTDPYAAVHPFKFQEPKGNPSNYAYGLGQV